MSDDDDEYEYDDDMDEQFEYTDEEEEQDDGQVALQNAYYNSKGLRESNLQEAAKSFEQVISLEKQEFKNAGSSKTYGPWSFKAMKQLVKLYLRTGQAEDIMKHYQRLLECIVDGEVNPNAIEKGINGMLERVASLYQGASTTTTTTTTARTNATSRGNSNIADPQALALAVYDATLHIFHPRDGSCKNERLWMKTNLKYGQLLYEMNETNKLQVVLKDLMSVHKMPDNEDNCASESGSSSGSSTQSVEIYALQIQLYSRQKDHKKLRQTFHKAMAVRGGIPHPRTLAMIQELGGKMHMAAREYESAEKTFFQAFKSYDEAGDPSRLRCLKYLVLASMLHASTINPFDSQEARPYRDDPEIVAMTNLVQAFHANEIQEFELILKQNKGRIMDDEFVREHIEDLLRTIRKQVLRRVIRPYKRISLQAVARELNDIPVTDVESLLVGLILDGQLDGKIDRVSGVLYKQAERGGADSSTPSKSNNAASKSDLAAGANGTFTKQEAMQLVIELLNSFSTELTSAPLRESGMRGMAH